MISYKILVTAEYPEDSWIFVDGKRFSIPKPGEDKDGLRTVLTEMLAYLVRENVLKVKAFCARNEGQKITNLAEMLRIEVILGTKDSYHSPQDIPERLVKAFVLLAWIHSKHFWQDERFGSCICEVCRDTTRGKEGPRPNLSENPIFWCPEHCLNIQCFSHEIEKMIDLNYVIPEEAYEETRKREAFSKDVTALAARPEVGGTFRHWRGGKR
ncbi:MAG: hypothetical protein NUV42_01235 [Candidatus Yonathbacteria bacterium]|nr:hypothetical protein [Candidatus Yonathbacteria bacterium]